MTEVTTSWIDRNANRLALIAIVGTCVCFIAFAYLLVQSGAQSKQGAKARERQQSVYPVSVKVYVDAQRRGVITAQELVCFKTGRGCPAPRSTPSP